MRSAGQAYMDLPAEMIGDRKEAPVRRRCEEVDQPEEKGFCFALGD
jgi:hypothetical protein